MKTRPKHLSCYFFCILKSSVVIKNFFLAAIILIAVSSCQKVSTVSSSISSDKQSSLTASDNVNIILMLADDIGYEVPTCDGGQSYSTPRIDQMASEGMRFTQCYSSPLCSPSRFMFLTGKYNFRNYDSWGIMDTTNRTIANMLRDNGYKTLVAGKWQLDGGDASIHALGFDDYIVYAPFGTSGLGKGSRYKDPTLYWQGALLPSDSMKGKYGEDVLVNYINNFIDSNKNNPFFIYYPVCLCHYPFCPTPDDPEFATWDNKTSTPDTMFFPSMVNYMDKKIGQVIDKVKADGIANKTIIIYVGDNGTDDRIYSYFRQHDVKGGKSFTYATGTRVPLIAWCPGKIKAKTTNNELVDFTDLLPTVADMAGVPVPSSYGIIDGQSFYAGLIGTNPAPRDWVFCHYDQNQQGEGIYPIRRWVNNANYKLYDTTYRFYNIAKDPLEKAPIPDSKLTPQQQMVKDTFMQVLSTMHN